jgi:hypothetical protein
LVLAAALVSAGMPGGYVFMDLSCDFCVFLA